MSSVLIVNEISTEREEITRALEAEGFTVVQAASAAEAVREIWGGSFLVAIIPTLLTGTTSTSLQQQLVQRPPDIRPLTPGKKAEPRARGRRVTQTGEGEAPA